MVVASQFIPHSEESTQSGLLTLDIWLCLFSLRDPFLFLGLQAEPVIPIPCTGHSMQSTGNRSTIRVNMYGQTTCSSWVLVRTVVKTTPSLQQSWKSTRGFPPKEGCLPTPSRVRFHDWRAGKNFVHPLSRFFLLGNP